MNIELARFLKEAALHNGNECEIRDGYSGRGMFGRTTYGVVVDSSEQMLSDVLQYVKDCLNPYETENPVGRSCRNGLDYDGQAIPDFSNLQVDSMGRSVILY